MQRSLPPLNALRAFEAAARLASFTRAARELHVTPAAISHQIRGLERHLGVVLFRRTTRRLELTGPGRLAVEHLRAGFDRLARGVQQLRSGAGSGALTVSVTGAFATRWLVPRLERLQRRCPDVELTLRAGTQPVDFDHDEIDAAIRIGRGGVAGATALPLFAECVVPLASPGFIRQHGLQRSTDLVRVPVLYDDSMRRIGRPAGWAEWAAAAQLRQLELRPGLHVDDGHLVLQAAAAGRGVALGRLAYALDDVRQGRLRVPFGPVLELDLKYYLLVPEARADEPAIGAFRDWLLREATRFNATLLAAVRAVRNARPRRGAAR